MLWSVSVAYLYMRSVLKAAWRIWLCCLHNDSKASRFLNWIDVDLFMSFALEGVSFFQSLPSLANASFIDDC